LTGVFSVLLIIIGYAQEEKQQSSGQREERHPTVMDSIDIVRDYRPMLADAVKIRRSPDMSIDRQALEIEMRHVATAMYFARNYFKQAYHSPLPEKYPDALRSNIDNNRIGILAYRAGEYERATSILEKVK